MKRVTSKLSTMRCRHLTLGVSIDASRLRAVVVALILTVGVLAVAAPHEGSPLRSEPARAQSLPTVSPTPTPRVIVINRPTPLPTPLPTPTVAAGQATVVETEVATSTPVGSATTPPPATATPSVLPTPVPTATATPPPPTMVLPTATVAPQPEEPIPTISPGPGELGSLITFTAEDWAGGYYRGDSQAYGRPWVALYGASSNYPQAQLTFRLAADVAGDSVFTVTGLDDEWAASNEIRLEVNGATVFVGPGPFPNWDGVGNGANAAWTSVSFTIPSGMLRAGPNTIEIANRTPGSNYNAPPYVLLADATLQVPGASSGQTPPATENRPAQRALIEFTAEDWRGGYYRGDGQAYGRPWVALYGAQSAYASAALTFRIRGEPGGPATLRLTGLDDELLDPNQIRVTVNGQRIYAGASPFPNWDGVGNGANAAWTEASIEIPAGVLLPGRNEIVVSNLTPAANFNAPPYVLLAGAVLEIQAGA